MSAFWTSLFLVFCAEMGDKTQLVAIAFAAKYRVITVIGAILSATFVMHLLSVVIGAAAGRLFPPFLIDLLAGLSFLFFGIWTIRGKGEVDETKMFQGLGPFFAIALTFFISELGDRTMLTTIAIAGQQSDWLGVWIGSSIGMVLADGMAITAVKMIGKKLPASALRYSAASIFIICGICTLTKLIV